MLYKHKNGISFKKVEAEDLGLLKEFKDESWFGTHRTTINNMKNQLDWFENVSKSSTNIFLTAYAEQDKELITEERIGIFSIQDIDWMSQKGYNSHGVFKEHRKKGYGFKIVEAGTDFAFEILNLHKLECEVLENNYGSRMNLLAAGFKKEGNKIKSIYKNGVYLDNNIMGILREDWEKLERLKKYEGCCNISYYSVRREK